MLNGSDAQMTVTFFFPPKASKVIAFSNFSCIVSYKGGSSLFLSLPNRGTERELVAFLLRLLAFNKVFGGFWLTLHVDIHQGTVLCMPGTESVWGCCMVACSVCWVAGGL